MLRIAIVLCAITLATPSFAARCGGDFNTFVASMSAEAQAAGVSPSVTDAAFGVPPQILVAIWGLETDFGKGDMGKLPVVRTLATLAHDCRRSELFQGELLAALKIVQRGDLPLQDLIGAYAGEIGQTQFLPSSYIKCSANFDAMREWNHAVIYRKTIGYFADQLMGR